MRLTAALQAAVGAVPAAWLSGSFLTDKVEPNDLDCVYLVESSNLAAAYSSDPRKAKFLASVAGSGVTAAFGLLVDSYILEWTPTAGVIPPVSPTSYLSGRGYWDDLWSRERSNNTRESSVPRRGYVEVILDGYR
jgi:hypothetical protein